MRIHGTKQRSEFVGNMPRCVKAHRPLVYGEYAAQSQGRIAWELGTGRGTTLKASRLETPQLKSSYLSLRSEFRAQKRISNQVRLALLQAGDAGVKADQGIENREDVPAVLHHTLEHLAQTWLAFNLPVPASQHLRRYLDIPPKFLGRMTAKKQAVEEGCLALGILQFRKSLLADDELLGHIRKRSLPKVLVSSRGRK